MATHAPDSTTQPGDKPAAEAAVIDEEQYSHKRRLQSIHNAQERVVEVRNVVEDQLIAGQVSKRQARRYHRGAVEAYIMEAMPVLRSEELSLSQDYLNEVELGEVTIEPPSEFVAWARERVEQMPRDASVPTPVGWKITGLRSILELPSPLAYDFSVAVHDGKNSVDIHTRTVSQELPRDLLDAAFEETTQALEEAEIGLNVGEGRESNMLGHAGQWPWERDDILPHQLHDLIEQGDISASEIAALVEEEQSEEVTTDAGE